MNIKYLYNDVMSSEIDDFPKLPGYVSIKEAAKMLGVSERTVYGYATAGRLRGVLAAHVIMIPLEDVQNFQRGVSGRERKVTPLWRISSGDNTRFITSISVQMRTGKRGALVHKLEAVKKSKEHLFPGTVVRYIVDSETHSGRVILIFVWRGTVMPEEARREQALEAFRQELADVLDWSSAEYEHGTAFMHT
jgi:excisionase family DNA binding protein